MKDNGYSLRDVYKELWRGRDFEISHLWQRSVFLAVFMLAIAGAYGTYMMKMMFPEDSNTNKFLITSTNIEENKTLKIELKIDNQTETDNVDENTKEKIITSEIYQKIVPIFLTYLGIVFSMMWVMMAKGSKRLYEEYERGIDKMIEDEIFNHAVDDNYYPCHGNLPKVEKDKLSDCLFSVKAGDYSPSKINIAIGIATLIFWGGLCLLHIVILINYFLQNKFFYILFWSLFSVFVVVAIIFIILIYYKCKSSTCKIDLNNDDGNKNRPKFISNKDLSISKGCFKGILMKGILMNKKVLVSSEVKYIPICFLSFNLSIEEVEFYGKHTKIGRCAFYKCKNLKAVHLPEKLKEIKKETFRGCSSLTGIIIPSSVTKIGKGAFSECEKLKKVIFEDEESKWNTDDGNVIVVKDSFLNAESFKDNKKWRDKELKKIIKQSAKKIIGG